jgi:hypothetical protein
MTQIATRRMVSSTLPIFSRPVIKVSRRCNTSGMMMSFDTMMASATDSTITIAVAAESPPTKAAIVSRSEPADSGKANTNMSLSTCPALKVSRPATAIGTTNRLISTR